MWGIISTACTCTILVSTNAYKSFCLLNKSGSTARVKLKVMCCINIDGHFLPQLSDHWLKQREETYGLRYRPTEDHSGCSQHDDPSSIPSPRGGCHVEAHSEALLEGKCRFLMHHANSLCPGRCIRIFEYLILNGNFYQHIVCIFLWKCSVMDANNPSLTLVQVMAWCRQATSHYLSQSSPRYMTSPCHNVGIMAWWELGKK